MNQPRAILAYRLFRSRVRVGRLERPRTIALVGAKRGRLAELAAQVLVIADTHYGRVEDAQMTIYHILCFASVERAGAQ